MELPVCDYSFREFFELLGVRNVIKLLCCLFLEHQVLLKSAGELPHTQSHSLRYAVQWPSPIYFFIFFFFFFLSL